MNCACWARDVDFEFGLAAAVVASFFVGIMSEFCSCFLSNVAIFTLVFQRDGFHGRDISWSPYRRLLFFDTIYPSCLITGLVRPASGIWRI